MTFKTSQWLTTATIAVSVALTLPAAAEPATPAKPKKQPSAAMSGLAQSGYRADDKFRRGPLYFQNIYLGDDPDPFIRSQIQRDLGARFPGND
jgi:hypothetical protein